MTLTHFTNFNHAPDEARLKAVFPGVYLEETLPDLLGDKYWVTTPELWAKRQCLGSGSTKAEAWEDAYVLNSAEVWDRIFSGACIRDIEMEEE